MVASKSGRGELIDELRLAVGERARFVEDHRAAVGDLLEDGGVTDDDRALGGERDRADDGDGDGDEQRARRGDDHHGEEADGVAADEPGGETESDGDGRVDRAELIAEAAELRLLLLGGLHDFDDLGVARVGRRRRSARIVSADWPLMAPERTAEPGVLDIMYGSPVRYDSSMTPWPASDGAVDRADFVREDEKDVADGELVERDVFDGGVLLAMGDGRHAFGEGREDGRGAADGVGLEGFAAGEHEDDECAGQVFAEQDGGDDRDAGEEVGTELAIGELDEELPNQRDAAEGEREPEGRVLDRLGGVQAEAEDEVRGDGGDRQDGDGELLPVERRGLGHDGVRVCAV